MPSRLITVGLMMLACLLGSLPSLFLASQCDPFGLSLGVGCWVVLYAAIGASDWFASLLRRPILRRAIVSALVLRAILSICVPCGFIVDAVPGVLSIALVEKFSGLQFIDDDPLNRNIGESTGLTALTVLLQGCFLNAGLLITLALFYSHYAWHDKRRNAHAARTTTCLACGYDLRGSLDFGRCPECGTAFAPAPTQGAAAGSN